MRFFMPHDLTLFIGPERRCCIRIITSYPLKSYDHSLQVEIWLYGTTIGHEIKAIPTPSRDHHLA